jgi:hypothetical protein
VQFYDIYQHPEFGYRAVRRGFSWSAFLVPSLWAVRRGLGWMTLLLVAWSTLMFDIAQLMTQWVQNPLAQFLVLVGLLTLFGIRSGFHGYRWHARALMEEGFTRRTTLAATSYRHALKAFSNNSYRGDVLIANGV